MTLDIVVGTQWGDEGKGRIVDLLSARADYVARFNGGDNAGHTVTVGSQTIKLHLVPSGIIHAHTVGLIGNGVVINPATLLSEIEMLREAGVEITCRRLLLAYNAHLITPAHRALDLAQEQQRGSAQIGTTGRGIGPAYTDKAARRGLRMEDMLDIPLLREKIAAHTRQVNHQLQALYDAGPLDAAALADEYAEYAQILRDHICDVGAVLHAALREGKSVLAEGAQGALLDLDQGTYPYVTSSSPTAPGALVGLGLGIGAVRRVVGVTKAFQTRVGSGPFPSEVFGAEAERLRGSGANPWDEYGTTTGRPRRVGWLDGVLLRYSARLNGLTELVVTKLDVLSGLSQVRICTAYRRAQQVLQDLPLGPADLAPFQPVYQSLPGWEGDLTRARTWADLPGAAQAYIRAVEQLCGVPVSFVSVGPERHQVVPVAP